MIKISNHYNANERTCSMSDFADCSGDISALAFQVADVTLTFPTDNFGSFKSLFGVKEITRAFGDSYAVAKNTD